VFGHPRGLWVLAGTEFWDRVSFHGMQAMLVLYMTGDLLPDPGRTARILGFSAYRAGLERMTGPLGDTALAAQTFGFYIAMVTGLPLLGGWLGDRIVGRRIAVGTGALLMTAGHFALAFDALFLIALLLLMAGAGLVRGNLSAQIKALYRPGDRRETVAFQYYYVAINSGGFLAPLLTGAVAAIWGWHAGFAVAGLGMLAGLVVYLAGASALADEHPAASGAPAGRASLTPDERRRVLGLLLLWPVGVCFWIAQTQIWNVYNLWVRDHVALDVGGFHVPVPWFQSLDGLAGVVLVPLVLWVWARQAARGRESDVLVKLAHGGLIFGASLVVLAIGPWLGGADGRAPIFIPVLFHFTCAYGYLYVAPVAVAAFADHAPPAWRGTLLGVNTLAISAGSLVSGRLGSLYDSLPPAQFWLLHAAICAGAGGVLLVAAPHLRGLLHRRPSAVARG
jgi:POT family proton-dependent oligopeptide transporter